jgi:phage shock protein A
MLKRIIATLQHVFNLIKSWFGLGPEAQASEEIRLQKALEEQQKMFREDRDYAVKAIVAKNNLQKQVTDMAKKVDNLTAKSERARRRGQVDIAEQILKEQEAYQESLEGLRETLQLAIETIDEIKERIRRQESLGSLREQTSLNFMKSEEEKELGALHSAYRERAVKAITEKNDLQNKIKVAEYQVKNLGEKLARAQECGDTDKIPEMIQAREEYEKELHDLQIRLQRAVEVCEAINIEIQQKASEIRERMARQSHPKQK